MAKLKAGEWFLFEGVPAVLLSNTPPWDDDSDIKCVAIGKLALINLHISPGELDEYPRLNRAPWVVVRSARRVDEFRFYAVISPNGRECIISAGCRVFNTLKDARKHWDGTHHLHAAYDNQNHRDELTAWSLGYVEKVAAAMKAAR